MNLYPGVVAQPDKPTELSPALQLPGTTRFSPEPSRRGRVVLPLALGATAVALGLGLWSLSRQLAPQITPPPSAESAYLASFPEKCIAILPFETQGATPREAPAAEAVQDDIISALSRVRDLRVISSTSVSGYAPGKPRNLRAIAQSLGAGHILEGMVSRTADKVRIDLQLIDGRRDARLWNVSYERNLSDLFGIESDVVQRVASQLHATISPAEKAEISELPTQDLVAYSLYVRGKKLVASISSSQINEKLSQAVQVLDQAVARDPNFYLAYCQLAAAHDYIYFFGFDHTPARLAMAQAALNTVARLRPEAGETHLAKATFLYRCHLDYNQARAELALTQSALPNNSEVFEMIGYIDRRQGLWTESSRALQKAVNLDPRNVNLLQQIAASYEELRQFRAMAAALDRALELAPRDLDTRITRAVVEYEWRADTAPLHHTIDALLAENPLSASDFADQWFYLALSERDPVAVGRALAAIPATGTSTDINFPRTLCEALAAHARGDTASAQKAFLAARAEVEKAVREQPDYGPTLTVLGLIDAALGRKEEAMREGQRAVALLPATKDALDGAELMKYLGVIYVWCGEKNRALDQIAATLRIPGTLNYGNLKLRPYWDGLRGDPRFEKIVQSLAPKG